MHVSEGVLSAPVLITGAAAAAPLLVYGFKKLTPDRLPKTALLSSVFFVGSFIHIPIGPSSVHLLLNGIIGALLGATAFPALFIALLLQGLLFQFGGLTTLGVNSVIIGLPASLGFVLFRAGVKRSGFSRTALFALTGALPITASALILSLALAFSGEQLLEAAQILLVAHVPVMLVEGVATIFLGEFLLKVYPQVLE